MKRHPNRPAPRRAGMALPVVLIILALMLVGAVYLLKSVHSTGLTTANLAYDNTLSRQADLGLHAGFAWLNNTAATNKPLLNQDSVSNGYVASRKTGSSFWDGKTTITDSDGTRIEYVIHRMCNKPGAYNDPTAVVQCVQTAANNNAPGSTVPLGSSMIVTAAQYAGTPRLHYTVTARIAGARGASVTNQLIVLIGA